MLRHRVHRGAAGRRRRRLPRGVRAEELAHDIIEINITNLAGVPSIVYGLLALGLFVYQFGLGQSILSAGLTLALLILPVVIVATREAIRSIPQAIREAAYALGATSGRRALSHAAVLRRRHPHRRRSSACRARSAKRRPLITIGALTFIAFLPPAPISARASVRLLRWLMSPFTVMPIQMFNWMSRPEAGVPAPTPRRRASCFVFMTVA